MLKPGSRRMPVPSVAGPLPVPAGGCAVVAPWLRRVESSWFYAVLIISTLQAKAKIQRNMAVLLGNRRDDAPKCNASRKQNPEYTNETATRLEAQEDANLTTFYRPARASSNRASTGRRRLEVDCN
jgi:hypothetical protein